MDATISTPPSAPARAREAVAGAPPAVRTPQESGPCGSDHAVDVEDAQAAGDLAQSLALDDDRTWAELIKAYEKVDPIATLPIRRRLVEHELVDAGAQHYRLAAQRLGMLRKISAGTASSAEVDDLVADLREIHRCRPRLQQEFDRAGLAVTPSRESAGGDQSSTPRLLYLDMNVWVEMARCCARSDLA